MFNKSKVILSAVLISALGLTGCTSGGIGDGVKVSGDSTVTQAAISKKKNIDVENVFSSNFTIIESYEDNNDNKNSTQISVSEIVKPNHQIGIVEKDLVNKDAKESQFYYRSDDNGSYIEYKNDSGSWEEGTAFEENVPTYISIVDNDTSLCKNMKSQGALNGGEVYSGYLKAVGVRGLQSLVKQHLGKIIEDNDKIQATINVKDNQIKRMSFDLSDLSNLGVKNLNYIIIINDVNKLTELELPAEALQKDVNVTKTSEGIKIDNASVLGVDWKTFTLSIANKVYNLNDWTESSDNKDTSQSEWVKYKDGIEVLKTGEKVSGVRVTDKCKVTVVLPSDVTIGDDISEVEKVYGKSKDYKYTSENGYLNITVDNNKVVGFEYVRS